MTLDEAIKHCKEKAKELRIEAEQLRDIGEVVSNPKQPYNEPVKDCLECANEHEQLAEWLEDYKRLLGEKSYAMGYQDGLEDGLQDIRPQGEWIKHSTYKDVLICSNCNHGSNQVYDTFNFCPNCGADMREEGKA